MTSESAPLDLREGGILLGPDGPLSVQKMHETHTAHVLVTERHAFKVRKAVNLGFLDYSTPTLRRKASEAECALGQRISPHVYLGVWSLMSGAPPRLSAAPDGQEAVVAMQRLDDALQMSRVFSDPTASPESIEEMLACCAQFHAACPVDRRPDGWGALDRTRGAWSINFEQMPEGDPSIPLASEERTRLVEETAGWLRTLEPTLRRRIEEGRIREGHGDLRLEHVYLTRPWSVIDPLEFSRELRFCDVAAEVGFLAMELDDLGRGDVADHLLRRYAALTEDGTLLAVAPFFMRYRAVVRGKVEWIRSQQVSGRAREAHRQAARRLFTLALSYSLP